MESFTKLASLIRISLFRSGVRLGLFCGFGLASATFVQALGQERYVSFEKTPADFSLVNGGQVAGIVIEANDFLGVQRAARDLQSDVQKVSGLTPALNLKPSSAARNVVIVGTIDHSAAIDRLIKDGKLNVMGVRGRWESFVIQVIDHPSEGVDRALVIAGSDKRGTIYGIYDLSEQMGVSPWYWWADVPVAHRDTISIRPGRFVQGSPAVKYRGIFLNDEAPALSGWTKEKFGGYNHAFYEHVFELLLRLKGNYLWPAMWGSAFNEDDPANPRLADEYGIVMGTSHHEPMLRAQQEWKRHGTGAWDYSKNADVLKNFWTEGVKRNRAFESITTIGMRGDGDMPMSEENNIASLEKIVGDQRAILKENVNPDLTKIPQLWALYKEVQGYYEKGMRVPDDVTLLWCDDNWGNIRRLPTEAERTRSGGAGVYYHFDYVGGPRNYKWINVTPITKVWEQMNLARSTGADRIWIVNVGDLKPMEFPIEFFLTMAWAPDRYPAEKLRDYTVAWATREFGPEHALEIAKLVSTYTQYNGRRKPELLAPETYSLVNYNEANTVWTDFDVLVNKTEKIKEQLPPEARDAFFELVLHPIKASAIVNQLYIAAGRNHLYAAQGRTSTDIWAERTRELFKADAALTHEYNVELKAGKWDHMMDQTHLGYTRWQQPPTNVMPEVKDYSAPISAELGVSVEGSETVWSNRQDQSAVARLPLIDSVNRTTDSFELFRRATDPVPFRIEAKQPWLKISLSSGVVTEDLRVKLWVDWDAAPDGATQGQIIVHSAQHDISLNVPIRKVSALNLKGFSGFVESDGMISIEAASFDRAVSTGQIQWRVLPDFGRTLSAVTSAPAVFAPVAISPLSPHLEYKYFSMSGGEMKAQLIFAPSQAFQPGRGLRCAVSIDDEAPQTIDIAPENNHAWEQEVMDSVRTIMWTHPGNHLAGAHVLKIWAIDPGVVVEKIILDFGGLRPSYMGPPETARINPNGSARPTGAAGL